MISYVLCAKIYHIACKNLWLGTLPNKYLLFCGIHLIGRNLGNVLYVNVPGTMYLVQCTKHTTSVRVRMYEVSPEALPCKAEKIMKNIF
jgi:hypothetical protein